MTRSLGVLCAFSAAVIVACSSSDTAQEATGGPGSMGTQPAVGDPPKKDAGTVIIDSGAAHDPLDDPFTCTPGATPTEFYALASPRLGHTDITSMCRFRGSVVLVVNTASQCGYTPQYTPLEAVYEKYHAQKFAILGFPCNQFGGQEPGSAADISSFCTGHYGITFPMFNKIDVNGAGTDPIYTWLKAQPGGAGDITWNFNKFLLGRDGKLIKRYPSDTTPDSAAITADIEAALAK